MDKALNHQSEGPRFESQRRPKIFLWRKFPMDIRKQLQKFGSHSSKRYRLMSNANV